MTILSFSIVPGAPVDVLDHAVACTIEQVRPAGAVRLRWPTNDDRFEPSIVLRGLPISPPQLEEPGKPLRLQAWSSIPAHLTIRTRP